MKSIDCRIWSGLWLAALIAGVVLTAQTASAQDVEKDAEALFAGVMGEDPLVSEEAREELLLLGRRAAPVVARHLADATAAPRYVACELLGQIGDPTSAAGLLERLKDAELYARSVRSAAARALARTGDAKAVPALLEALKVKDDAELQYEAAVALGALRATEAVDALIGLLGSDGKTYHDRLIAAGAAQALGRIRSEKAIPELGKLLDKSLREPATDLSLAYYAARALERISGQNLGSLTTSDEVREATLKQWKDWVAKKAAPAGGGDAKKE